MIKSISPPLLTIPSIVYALAMFLLSGIAMGQQALPNPIEGELKDGVDRGMDGVIICVNRPGDTSITQQNGITVKNKFRPIHTHYLRSQASVSYTWLLQLLF